MPKAPLTGAPASFAEGGAAVVDLARALTAATDFQQLEHAFTTRSGRLDDGADVRAPRSGPHP